MLISGPQYVARGQYRAWDEPNLMNAMVAVEKGVSLRRAAEMYRVPKSTLYDHVTGKVAFGARSGPNPYLTTEEEEELCSFLVQVAKIGYPHTKKQVLALVQQILSAKGITSSISNGLWERYCQRNPGITLRSAVPLSLARAAATDPEMLSRYYDTLEECLQSNEIFDNPNAIYNCDETGLPLNPPALRVVQEIGAKNPNFVTGGNKSQEYVPSTRPLILLLDGHSSHYSSAFIKLAAEEGIIIFVLPPNTTHITQPLDKGCFSPLKVAWRQACHDYRTRFPGRVVTRLDFNQVFSEAWYLAMTPHNIVASFNKHVGSNRSSEL